jgi:hypothetical protein
MQTVSTAILITSAYTAFLMLFNFQLIHFKAAKPFYYIQEIHRWKITFESQQTIFILPKTPVLH